MREPAPTCRTRPPSLGGRLPWRDPEGEKILTQAQADPSQALTLGILPADTTALSQALAAVTAAEAVAKSAGGTTGATAKQLHAAEVSMHEAVARIAGAGALAFATNAAVRAQFEALKPTKKKKKKA